MSTLYGKCLLVIGLCFVLFVGNASSQCSLVNKGFSSLYVTFERTDLVRVDGEEKPQSGIVFRLHNNSTCTIVITTGSADQFLKPLPPNPTPIQRIKREIEYDLPDGVLVTDVQYRYQTREDSGFSVGGDMFFEFNLLGGRTLLFAVPFKHLDPSFASELVVEFEYAWDQSSNSNVKHFVRFWIESLPEGVKKEIRKSK